MRSPIASFLFVLPIIILVLCLPSTGFAVPAGEFPDCVVNDSGNSPFLDCGGEIIDIRTHFDSALARIKERERDAINGMGLYERYLHKLSASDQALVEDLSELGMLLATDYPELHTTFVQDISKALARLREQISIQTRALVTAYKRFDPSIGLGLQEPIVSDSLADVLREIGLEHFVVSGEPAEIMALEVDPPPISALPFRFSSLHGPLLHAHDVNGAPSDFIDAASTFHFEVGTWCTRLSDTCVWPAGWDYLPYEFTLVWESLTLTQEEVDAIVQEDGYILSLTVNGIRLKMGPPPAGGAPGPLQGFYAVVLPPSQTSDGKPHCPPGSWCIATSFLDDEMRKYPLPWRIGFEIEKVVELDPPIVIIDSESGNAVSWVQGREPFSNVSKTISPNATNGQSFFVEAIGPTFKSDRCMDCHGFGTPDALAVHHGYGGNAGTESFVNDTSLELEPSAYVPGAHVMTCANCHHVPTTDKHGHHFEETVWIAPYIDLDVDWRTKTTAQICRRVMQNLPTHELRHKHFSEDARLYWAIEEPAVMGTPLPPKAYPGDFDNFLFRIFLWSKYVDNCP